jgi:hypothetical protein
VEIDLTEPVALTFSLKYLVNFCKASGLSGTVKLCLSNEVPLLVEYALAGSSYLRFYLAPKVRGPPSHNCLCMLTLRSTTRLAMTSDWTGEEVAPFIRYSDGSCGASGLDQEPSRPRIVMYERSIAIVPLQLNRSIFSAPSKSKCAFVTITLSPLRGPNDDGTFKRPVHGRSCQKSCNRPFHLLLLALTLRGAARGHGVGVEG